MEFGFTPQLIKTNDNLFAPEIYSKKYGLPVDIWQLGLLAWQLMHMKVFLIDD